MTRQAVEKEVLIPRRNVAGLVKLEALCHKHNVELETTPTMAIIKLSRSSENLLEFSGAIRRYELIERMDESRKEALARDLSSCDLEES
jgi:hypothetical protein